MSNDLAESTELALVASRDALSAADWQSPMAEAFQVSQPELNALPKDKLAAVNVDVRSAVITALGATKRLRPWRARIVAELPRFDINSLDQLGRYAWSLAHAEVAYTIARKGPGDVRALVGSTQRIHRILLAEVGALVERGLMPKEVLKKARGRRKHLDRGFSLAGLVHVLRKAWPAIETKTGLTLAELDAAENQALTLVTALASKKTPLQELARIAEQRQRAFTLFSNAYGQVRRALQYLCQDSDEVERVLPTLYPRKRRSKRREKPAADQASVVSPVARATSSHSEFVPTG